jgi:23S rRNA (cytosine1962-C5)-methyltransferase
MILETYEKKWDFELLDTGDGFRLERWGEAILARPDPQIIWQKSLPQSEWQKADAIFVNRGKDTESEGERRGQWEIKNHLPDPWTINFNNLKFLLKLSPFKHTGLFAEQSAQWNWMMSRLQIKEPKSKTDSDNLNPKFKILNLFGYTGGATMVLAKAGCFVTHVDASKPAITWANENHALNNLPADSARWILDDAVKFVKREVKRGTQYDGIIMDPPAFGHSPSGKTWKFNDDLPELLQLCVQLLSPKAKFLLINGYATNSSALALNNLLQDAMRERSGNIDCGELCLKQTNGRTISTGIFARWSK